MVVLVMDCRARRLLGTHELSDDLGDAGLFGDLGTQAGKSLGLGSELGRRVEGLME